MTTPTKLSTVLQAAAPLLVDDEKAAEHDRIVREAREVDARQQRADRIDREEIPLRPRMRAALINGTGLDNLPSLRVVSSWRLRRDARPWLVLAGGTGCGKSVAAAWALVNGPASGVWCSARRLVHVFAGYFGESAQQQALMMRCKLLVLDDIGTELDRERERMSSALVELLEQRKGRRTIVTANLAQADWETYYPDPRLHSRLRESARFFTDTSPDMRGKKTA